MIHVLQSLRTGKTELADVPVPRASPQTIVVETRASVISAGTERMIVDFGRGGWFDKARAQPDKVRQVLEKVRTDGVMSTMESVRSKLDSPVPLGYCQAGIVREVGASVTRFAPGDRVVTNGPHAEYVRVTQTLAAKIPDGVPYESAAFAPLAAIGLQGLRLANPTLGETVVVYGLGLIGLLTVQLARAAGCRAIGIDRSPERCALAEQLGATSVHASGGEDLARAVQDLTDDVGADIVLLTLASDSDEPVHHAAEMCRKRGRIVLTGVSGLSLRRDDFYRKELSFQVSCSYGPGRYDPAYENSGVDYPLPYVRWTEARNFDATLSLMSERRLETERLVTHRFPIREAPAAYDVISGTAPSLGVVLSYEAKSESHLKNARTVTTGKPTSPGKAIVGFIGAGNFASRVLIPAFDRAGAELRAVASGGGLSASIVGKENEIATITTDADSLLSDASIDTIVIATRHDSHAQWVLRALETGKHVFVEKPLALTLADLEAVRRAAQSGPGILCVGFNRRFAPHVIAAKKTLVGRTGPLAINLTVNAGSIPRDHWTRDPLVGGGRIVGEACHFIDLCRNFVGAPISGLQVLVARGENGTVLDDIATIQMSFTDGSIATIQYLANGNRAFPKERVELFFDEKTIRLENFRSISAWGVNGIAARARFSQDKGHTALVMAFVAAVRSGGPPPIPADEIFETSDVSIQAALLARGAGGSISLTSSTF